jgi:hypothetical protein
MNLYSIHQVLLYRPLLSAHPSGRELHLFGTSLFVLGF